MSSTRNSSLAIGAALALAALAIVLLLRGGREDAQVPPRAPKAVETYAPAAPSEKPAVARAKGLVEGGEPNVELLEKSLADYKAVSVYPHWSRPHSDESVEKLDWNRTVVADNPMDDRDGIKTIYHFGANRWNVPHGEPFVSWIEVLTVGPDAKRLPVVIKDAQLMGLSSGRAAGLTYRDDGKDGDEVAGDLRYTNRVVPSEITALGKKAQQVHIEATIEAGGVARPVTRDFAYAPRKAAEITGAREELRGGHLVVTLEVDVVEQGLYTFDANVFAQDGTPLVYGEKSYTLEPGKRTAELVMFGRAFVEKGKDGPYVVKDMRGMRRFVDTDEQNFYFVYGKTLTTRGYAHTELSAAEWDEPERRDTIANFERLIRETRDGYNGLPGDEPPDPSGPPVAPGAEPTLPAGGGPTKPQR
ncbi:MAG: hypothetical protein JNL83_29440 [Myxococcales bacterium]|nr:hypothetical protein [Myxococcales bacterium]